MIDLHLIFEKMKDRFVNARSAIAAKLKSIKDGIALGSQSSQQNYTETYESESSQSATAPYSSAAYTADTSFTNHSTNHSTNDSYLNNSSANNSSVKASPTNSDAVIPFSKIQHNLQSQNPQSNYSPNFTNIENTTVSEENEQPTINNQSTIRASIHSLPRISQSSADEDLSHLDVSQTRRKGSLTSNNSNASSVQRAENTQRPRNASINSSSTSEIQELEDEITTQSRRTSYDSGNAAVPVADEVNPQMSKSEIRKVAIKHEREELAMKDRMITMSTLSPADHIDLIKGILYELRLYQESEERFAKSASTAKKKASIPIITFLTSSGVIGALAFLYQESMKGITSFDADLKNVAESNPEIVVCGQLWNAYYNEMYKKHESFDNANYTARMIACTDNSAVKNISSQIMEKSKSFFEQELHGAQLGEMASILGMSLATISLALEAIIGASQASRAVVSSKQMKENKARINVILDVLSLATTSMYDKVKRDIVIDDISKDKCLDILQKANEDVLRVKLENNNADKMKEMISSHIASLKEIEKHAHENVIPKNITDPKTMEGLISHVMGRLDLAENLRNNAITKVKDYIKHADRMTSHEKRVSGGYIAKIVTQSFTLAATASTMCISLVSLFNEMAKSAELSQMYQNASDHQFGIMMYDIKKVEGYVTGAEEPTEISAIVGGVGAFCAALTIGLFSYGLHGERKSNAKLSGKQSEDIALEDGSSFTLTDKASAKKLLDRMESDLENIRTQKENLSTIRRNLARDVERGERPTAEQIKQATDASEKGMKVNIDPSGKSKSVNNNAGRRFVTATMRHSMDVSPVSEESFGESAQSVQMEEEQSSAAHLSQQHTTSIQPNAQASADTVNQNDNTNNNSWTEVESRNAKRDRRRRGAQNLNASQSSSIA